MTTAYWAQYSHSEIMSMQGVEEEEGYYYEDVEEIENEDNSSKEQYCCSGCMSCLMVSW